MKKLLPNISLIFLVLLLVMAVTLFISCRQGSDKQNFSHPRIIFLSGDERELNMKIQSDRLLNGIYNAIIEASEGMLLLEPLGYKKTGRRLLSVSRTYLKRILYLSFSYRVTGDRKFLEKAELEMLEAASFTDWNPDHFLDVAEMTMALAIGYDWLYADLNVGSREKISEAILNKGILPSMMEEYNGWLNVTHNWNQVCNAGMSFGAWAIYDQDTLFAREIIQRAVESLKLPSQDYEPDGAYPEGPMYWTYGTSFHVMFIDAYERSPINSSVLDISDGFLKSGEYFLHVFGPNGSFNYADCHTGSGLSPALFWYAGRQSDKSLLFNQKYLLDEFSNGNRLINPDGSSDRLLPLLLIWLSRCGEGEIDPPSLRSWSGGGSNPVSLHRTSWNKKAIFAAIKGGSPSVNHGHMDVGGFVIDAMGVRWAMDLGGHDYYALEKQGINLWDRSQEGERWSIFRYNNMSHNTLVINDKHQVVEGKGRIIRSSANEGNMFTVLDISEVYQDQLVSASRGISIIDNSYIMIQDEVKNISEPGKLRWAMLTHDSLTFIDNKSAWIYHGNHKLKFQILRPERTVVTGYSAEPPMQYEEKNPGKTMIGFDYSMAPDEEIIFTVLLMPEGRDISNEEKWARLQDW